MASPIVKIDIMSLEKNKKSDSVFGFEFLEKGEDFGFLNKIKGEFPQAEVFLVGGAVRDLLLLRPTKDYDFVVRNVPAGNLEDFLAKEGTVNLVGQTFGVFKFIPRQGDPHNPIDIALPRKDFSLAIGGYRDVEIQSNPNLAIQEDLSRRDFTINALAVNLTKEQGEKRIVDLFGGLDDLKKGLIRTVGRPEQRFKEDYSRLLRGIRLACQFNFQIEEYTWQAIKEKIKGLNEIKRSVELIPDGQFAEPKVAETRVVPYETIAKEFLRAFAFNPSRAFDLYDQSGAFQELMPEILKMKDCPQPENYHTEGDVWEHTRLALKNLTSADFKKQFETELSNEVIIAVLLHDLGKPYTLQTPEKDGADRIRFNEHDVVGARMAKEIADRLKLSSPDKIGLDAEEMSWLVENHMILIRGDIAKMRPGTIEKYFFSPRFSGDKLLQVSFADISATITKEGGPNFDKFNQMLERIENLRKLSQNKKDLPESLLNGHKIMEIFNLKPGPKVGELLGVLREEQLNGKIRDKDEAIKFLKKELANHS